MEQTLQFGEVLDAADKLTEDEQAALIDILRRRRVERERERLIAEVEEGEREFERGGCPPKTTDEIMRDILS